MTQNMTDPDSSQIGSLDPSKLKILIGMTGKIDSTITAFLLQKQGYQCIGIGIVSWNQPNYDFNLNKTCSVNNLEEVKSICEELNMPFYAVDAQKEYTEKVINQFMSNRLALESTFPCYGCHQMKLAILYDKLKVLNADFIATGHFAKCYKNHSNNTFAVHSSVDKQFDQSYLLASADQAILRKLILPLAELHRTEVVKLAKKFNLVREINSENEVCFSKTPEIIKYIQANFPEDFRKKGSMIDVYTNMPTQEHQGIYNFELGQKTEEESRRTHRDEEPKVVVDVDYEHNSVYVGLGSDYQFDFFQLSKVELNSDIDQSRPINLMAKFSSRDNLYTAEIRFKNNHSVIMTLAQKIPQVAINELVIFYNKDTAGSKILGKGTISYVGEFNIVNRAIYDQSAQNTKSKTLDENGNPVVPEKISEFRF